MLKNITIVLLVLTNCASGYYIYTHMQPIRNVTVDTRTETEVPLYFYRILLKNGGIAEGIGVMKKEKTIDLIDKKSTTTFSYDDIKTVEKVYYSTGKTTKIVTRNVTTKKYN